MFIIFGWNNPTEKNYGATLPVKCPRCNNNVFMHLQHVKLWFTLFFIPIIPYESKYYLSCEICGCGKELVGDEIDHAKKLNETTTAFLNHSISKEQYLTALNSGRDIKTNSQGVS